MPQYAHTTGRSPLGLCRESVDWPTRIEKNERIIQKYNTDLFANVNGMDVPVYDSLATIPPLNDGDQCVLNGEGLEDIPNWKQGDWHARLYRDVEMSGQLFPSALIIAVAVAIGLTSVTLAVYFITRFWNAPCGVTGHEEKIDECRKLVVYPNCDGVVINYCTGPCSDYTTESECENAGCYWRDGHCYGQGVIEDEWKSRGWIELLVIGGLVLGGGYLLLKGVQSQKGNGGTENDEPE